MSDWIKPPKSVVAKTKEKPDPMFGEKTIVDTQAHTTLKIKVVLRKPKTKAERKMLQKDGDMIARNCGWLYKDPCPYGCKRGSITVYPYPDNKKLTASEYCRCIGEAEL